MRLFAPLLLLLASTPGWGQPLASRCYAACARHVPDERLRASACSACLTSADNAQSWLARLPRTPPGLLSDEDWEVRWAGLIAEARQQKTTGARRLAAWIHRARKEELERACLTGLHVAGALDQSLARLLEEDAKALATCQALAPALRKALWVELYAAEPERRLETLSHLAPAFGRGAGREVLDALAAHAAGFDGQILDTLASWTARRDRSAAAEVLAAATPADVEVMNRVLAVYATLRDEHRAALSAPEESDRRAALHRLGDASPLSAPELLEGLDDPAPAVRLVALKGLARGEGGGLAGPVEARVLGRKAASVSQQQAMLELLRDSGLSACAPVALEAWRRADAPAEVRRIALRVAAACNWQQAREDVLAAVAGAGELERSTGLAALGSSPRTPDVEARLVDALGAKEPALRAAACEALGRQRWRTLGGRLEPLAVDPSAEVRAAALRALVAMDGPGVEAKLTAALQRDAEPRVRATAAELLQGFGTPRVLSALEQAARADADASVKLVAAQSLRKLAPGSRSP